MVKGGTHLASPERWLERDLQAGQRDLSGGARRQSGVGKTTAAPWTEVELQFKRGLLFVQAAHGTGPVRVRFGAMTYHVEEGAARAVAHIYGDGLEAIKGDG